MPQSTHCIKRLLLIFLTAGLVEAPDNSVNKVCRSNQDFATALYSELAKEDNSTNVFFSPLSIHVILALAYVGAGGQTAQEMATGLRLPDNVDVVKTGFQRLLQGMNNDTDSVELQIANKIYLAVNYSVNDEFNKVAKDNFFASVENVDFSLGEKTSKIINEWVKNITHDTIKDIISRDLLKPPPKLLLINAVHFKANWGKPFEKPRTAIIPFYITPKKTKNVEMMYVQSEFTFVRNKDIGADILELPYKGNTTTLLVILPLRIDGLPNVENKLRATNLTTIFESLKGHKTVDVFIPKFKMEQSIKLKDYLIALGMTTMFQDNADFSPMSDDGISVSEVLHKAFFEVNEEGTKASASTAIMSTSRIAGFSPSNFYANHPFMFILHCKISGAVLFMGRFSSPQ